MINVNTIIKKINFKNTNDFNIDLNINDFDLNISFNEEIKFNNTSNINESALNIFKNVVSANENIKIKEIKLFNENNANISVIKFKLNNNLYEISIDWFKVKIINKIQLPFLNNIFTSNYIDQKIVADFISLNKNNNQEDQVFVNMSLIMYFNAIFLERILHIYLLINQFLILETHYKKRIFSVYKREDVARINNKDIKITTTGHLTKNGKFNLNIMVSVNGDIYYVTMDSLNEMFLFNSIKNILKVIHEKDFEIRLINMKNGNKKEDHSTITYLLENENENDNIVIENDNFNNFYLNGNSYTFNEINFNLEEIENFEEYILNLNKKLLKIFNFIQN